MYTTGKLPAPPREGPTTHTSAVGVDSVADTTQAAPPTDTVAVDDRPVPVMLTTQPPDTEPSAGEMEENVGTYVIDGSEPTAMPLAPASTGDK